MAPKALQLRMLFSSKLLYRLFQKPRNLRGFFVGRKFFLKNYYKGFNCGSKQLLIREASERIGKEEEERREEKAKTGEEKIHIK